MAGRIPITQHIWLDPGEIHEDFIHAAGPGGQNINKVSTAVRLRFDVQASPALPDEVKQRLLRLAGKRATSQGELVLEARQYRTQEKNRQAALERLVRLVQSAAEAPKLRHPTRPTLAAKQRRMAKKMQRGEIKRLRRFTPEE